MTAAARRAALHRPIRPRAGRWVPYALAVVWLAVFGLLAAGYPPYPGLGPLDRAGFAALGLAGAWLLYRFGAVAVLPAESGLTVRNVLGVRRLVWEQVVSVRFGRDSTWGQLDLTDGTTLAVLAIQAADGRHAERLAARLATLVELHGYPDDQPGDRGATRPDGET